MGGSKGNVFGKPLHIYLFIYLYQNHDCHIRNIAVLTDSCLSVILGSVTGPWQLLFIFSWKNVF